jgi:hypothetical protein
MLPQHAWRGLSRVGFAWLAIGVGLGIDRGEIPIHDLDKVGLVGRQPAAQFGFVLAHDTSLKHGEGDQRRAGPVPLQHHGDGISSDREFNFNLDTMAIGRHLIEGALYPLFHH